MAKQSVQPEVVKYLRGRIGVATSVEDISTMTNFNHSQIRSVMLRLVTGGEVDITVISRGHVWRVNSMDPKPSQSKKSLGIFEEVGVLQGGAKVVRDEDGQLFKLEPM
jgi:hypothetical protein